MGTERVTRYAADRAPGATVQPDGRTLFRVWAPRREKVEVRCEGASVGGRVPLARTDDGFFTAATEHCPAGSLYRYVLDGDALHPRPDPASRFQPEGPDGPSLVVDPSTFRWTDENWAGPALPGQVLYEIHVGTFTPAGTWRAAAEELPALAELGVTLLEVMPIAEFAGRFGWGYDGVLAYAPFHHYGTPDDLRAFVDRAHDLGVGVILDVVYNHLGPRGNHLPEFSDRYLHSERTTDWGPALNFDGEDSGPVREYFVGNSAYWIREFHFDGLRFDATQDVADASDPHVLVEMARAARAAAGNRRILLVAENEPQDSRLFAPESEGGFGLDLVWNDDFHHAATVAATGRREAYYNDYFGSPQELISAARRGYLYQGQWYSWQNHPRGRPTSAAPAHFVHYLQNHDQVANSLAGRRIHELAAPAVVRALTTVLLLGPATPLLFQGQEFAATTPFRYFADHNPDLAAIVAKGRGEFLAQFPSIAAPEAQAVLPPPHAETTFRESVLDPSERGRRREWSALHRDLLRIRREDPVIAGQGRHGFDGAVLGEGAFLLRYFERAGADRLLVVNLGPELRLTSMPEPLLAPPAGAGWRPVFVSESPVYGGEGSPEFAPRGPWRLPTSAVLFAPEPERERP